MSFFGCSIDRICVAVLRRFSKRRISQTSASRETAEWVAHLTHNDTHHWRGGDELLYATGSSSPRPVHVAVSPHRTRNTATIIPIIRATRQRSRSWRSRCREASRLRSRHLSRSSSIMDHAIKAAAARARKRQVRSIKQSPARIAAEETNENAKRTRTLFASVSGNVNIFMTNM